MDSRQVGYVVFIILYDLLFIVSTLLLALFRNAPALRFRAVWVTLAQSAASCILVNLVLTRLFRSNLVSCGLMAWIPAYVVPAVVFLHLLRYLWLARAFWRAKLALAVDINDRRMLRSNRAAKDGEGAGVAADKYAGEVNARWQVRMISWFGLPFVAVATLLFVVLQTLMLLRLQLGPGHLLSASAGADESTCSNLGIARAPVYIGTAAALLLIPVIITALRGVTENYGIIVELHLGSAILLLTLGAATVLDWTSATATSVLGNMRQSIASSSIIAGGLLLLQIAMVLVPSIQGWLHSSRKQRRLIEPKLTPSTHDYAGSSNSTMANASTTNMSNTPQQRKVSSVSRSELADPERADLDRIFREPDLLCQFKEFAVAEFAVDQVLFLEQFMEARATADDDKPGWRAKFRTLYEEHLDPACESVLPLSKRTMKEVQEVFGKRANLYGPTVLDKTSSEVKVLLYEGTYPKFMESRR